MDSRRWHAIDVLQIAAVAVLLWFLITWRGPWNVQRVAGTVLTVVSVGLLGVARYQLGESFSVRPEARELVTQGIYSKIRNPIYVFGTLAFTGMILVLQKPVLWVVLMVAIMIQIFRARREARVLEAAFGDSYREYRRKTWF
jgi:protein-S-isoprenylcysteine O-methyltransferase Ste14